MPAACEAAQRVRRRRDDEAAGQDPRGASDASDVGIRERDVIAFGRSLHGGDDGERCKRGDSRAFGKTRDAAG